MILLLLLTLSFAYDETSPEYEIYMDETDKQEEESGNRGVEDTESEEEETGGFIPWFVETQDEETEEDND